MRLVFTKNEEKNAGNPGSESARPGPCRLWGSAAILVCVSLSGPLEGGPTCPVPANFKVCQDAYSQPEGRVFLVWENMGSYESHCIFVNDQLEMELLGTASLATISGLAPGTYKFAIQTHCGASLPSVLLEKEMTVLQWPEPGEPVKSMHCGFETTEQGVAFVVELEDLDAKFESVDIFVQELDEFPRFLKCLRLDSISDRSHVRLEIPEITDDNNTRVFLQFFDMDCHGSATLECLGPRTPPSRSQVGLQVFQTSYDEMADVILCWVRDGGQKGFEILVDGTRKGSVGALLDTYFLKLPLGRHDFEVRTIPWEGDPFPGEPLTVTLRSESPIPDPVGRIQTAFRPGEPLRCVEKELRTARRRGRLHVTWDPPSSIKLVDVFLRRSDLTSRSVTTISGEFTEIELLDVFEDEEVALQFFDGELFGPPGFGGQFFGSPVIGGGSFRRGDPNQDGTVDISDAVKVLDYLFSGGEIIDCLDAADANDSGEVDISDGMFILNFLFNGREAPPAPGHLECGLDVTGDDLPRCLGPCAG